MRDIGKLSITTSESADDVAERLLTDGLVIMRGWGAERIERLFRSLCDVVPHRDSDRSTAITTLTPHAGAAGRAGFAGFTHDYMAPHTDGSGVIDPPDLIGLSCVMPALHGGSAIFVDAAVVVRTLLESTPGSAEALQARGSVRFGDAAVPFSVLEPDGDKRRFRIRYRDVGLADYSEVQAAIETLRGIIETQRHMTELHADDGYILQNSRWLHGRSAFTGNRVMRRLQGNVRANSALAVLHAGFEPAFGAQA